MLGVLLILTGGPLIMVLAYTVRKVPFAPADLRPHPERLRAHLGKTVASELSATVVLYSGPWRTLTVVMFQALESGGGGVATAAASTLIVVTLLPIALLYRLVRRYELS